MIKFMVKEKEELEKLVSDRMTDIIRNKNNPFFILATGNSPIGVYKKLIEEYKNGLSFKNLTSFNLDEYREIKNFPDDSFRSFMDNNLFNHIDIKKENTKFPNSVDEYDSELDKIGKFDFTILGVGTNGHIAFNEPGSKFETRTNEVVLTESTIKSNFPGRTEYPTKAITMGLYDIYNKSNEIFLLAWGEGKREALTILQEGKKRDDWPITHFIDHPNMTVITDLKGFEDQYDN